MQMERQQASQMRKDAGLPRTRRCRKCRVSKSKSMQLFEPAGVQLSVPVSQVLGRAGPAMQFQICSTAV